jgi:thiol-disulfide isomerase/thioredoxin
MRTALLLLAGLALAGCNESAPTPASPAKTAADAAWPAAKPAEVPVNAIDRSHAGTPAPAIRFERRGGKTATLADFRGKPVLVNLWATWCAPCIAEMPLLDALAVAQAGKLVVLPISQDMEGWLAVGKFFTAAKFPNLEPYVDQPGSFAETLKARGLPISILYDAEGKEVWRVAGTPDWKKLAADGLA